MVRRLWVTGFKLAQTFKNITTVPNMADTVTAALPA
jgi:hypothetical protein